MAVCFDALHTPLVLCRFGDFSICVVVAYVCIVLVCGANVPIKASHALGMQSFIQFTCTASHIQMPTPVGHTAGCLYLTTYSLKAHPLAAPSC